ncbi:hypothetical protein N7492_002496 [Penicillium capsulatum]|uniref:Uncharacterized protein n=1 Tax=Penicillium capsulatum TaxID=69766 RepID=A0A9W9ILI4_9EURO|nr:hypothetical protein N7492_002496 [Penicillium capsulatum]KAJ6122900.1 hypothetical protein N7512_005365 [Penicillium capsulatum]
MPEHLASGGFPLFPALPRELQDYIWDVAARPFPGDRYLHALYAVDFWFNLAEGAETIRGDALRFGPDGSLTKQSYGLFVPWDDPARGLNTSAYRAIGGLWTACRGSRRAIERRYPKNEWWSDVPGPESECPHRLAGRGDYFNDPDASHTASYVDRQGRISHITISPQRDVVYFPESTVYSAVDWHYHYAGDHVPLLDMRNPDDDPTRPSFVGMDIALDFEPRWFDWAYDSLVDMIDLFHDECCRTVWLIDRRLRRRQASDLEEKSGSQLSQPVEIELGKMNLSGSSENVQFYSCRHVFTEVKENDQHLWEIEGEHHDKSIFTFFPGLAVQHNGRLRGIEKSERLRVLACEINHGSTFDP